jgi:hypothetical protein
MITSITGMITLSSNRWRRRTSTYAKRRDGPQAQAAASHRNGGSSGCERDKPRTPTPGPAGVAGPGWGPGAGHSRRPSRLRIRFVRVVRVARAPTRNPVKTRARRPGTFHPRRDTDRHWQSGRITELDSAMMIWPIQVGMRPSPAAPAEGRTRDQSRNRASVTSF